MEPKLKILQSPRVQTRSSDERPPRLLTTRFLEEQGQVFQYLSTAENLSPEKHQPGTPRLVQNMDDYSSPPAEGLPLIVREKDLAHRQRTMKHFLSIQDFNSPSEDIKKKQSHHKVHKNASLEYINNLANVACANYAQKKNHGLMHINELWGQKYHQSVLQATGLRKAGSWVKGKTLKVASERIKAVNKYYEDKHKDEIKREREFFELLVIPVENTQSNKDLKAMLNTEEAISRKATRMNIVHSPRSQGAGLVDFSYGFNQFKQGLNESGALSENRELGLSDLEDLTSERAHSINDCGLPTPGTRRAQGASEESLYSPKNLKLTKIHEEFDGEGESPLLKKGLNFKKHISIPLPKVKRDISIQEDSNNESPALSLNKTSSNKSAKRLASPQEEKEEKSSGSKIKLKIPLLKPMVPKNRPISGSANTSFGDSPISNRRSCGTPRTTATTQNAVGECEDFSIKMTNCGSLSSFAPKHSKGLSSMSNTVYPGNFGDRRLSSPSHLPEGLPQLDANSNTGVVKTEEIERLKKNFMNLMFYCEEVREDYQVKETMRETKKSAQELFATRNQRIFKEAKVKESKENLEGSIRRQLSQAKRKLKV